MKLCTLHSLPLPVRLLPAAVPASHHCMHRCKYTKGGFLRPSKQRRPRNANGAYGLGDSRSVSAPPYPGHPQGVPVDACGREKKLNPALVSKYSELVFQKHMDNATNDDVRVMYAQNNDQQVASWIGMSEVGRAHRSECLLPADQIATNGRLRGTARSEYAGGGD